LFLEEHFLTSTKKLSSRSLKSTSIKFDGIPVDGLGVCAKSSRATQKMGQKCSLRIRLIDGWLYFARYSWLIRES